MTTLELPPYHACTVTGPKLPFLLALEEEQEEEEKEEEEKEEEEEEGEGEEEEGEQSIHYQNMVFILGKANYSEN